MCQYASHPLARFLFCDVIRYNVGLVLDHYDWAELCGQTRQRNCTRGNDLEQCEGHDIESTLCQTDDVGG